MGPTGYTGSQGSGYAGSIGSLGYTGSIGFVGSLGFTGSGYTGSSGYAGSVGYTGSFGSLGYTGSIGAGYTGSASTAVGYTGSGYTGSVGFAGSVGYTGSIGYTGSSGFTGSQGNKGGLRFNFSTTTSAGTTANGDLRYDSGTVASVANLYINANDANGLALGSFIATWGSSTNPVKAQIIIQDNLNTVAFTNIFNISGSIVNNTTYYTIPVTYVSGTAIPSNTEQLSVTFARSGDVGYTGSIGDRSGIKYYFDTTTSAGTTATGSLRYNSATVSSVTSVYINTQDFNSNLWSGYIGSWGASSTPIKGVLTVKENISSNTIVNTFQVTALSGPTGTAPTAYYTLTVQNGVGTLPTLNDIVTLDFSRTGDLGYTGSIGERGGMRFTFDSTTTAGVGSNGSLRFNNATIGSATAIYINILDANGVSNAAYISTWANSSNPTGKGTLLLKETFSTLTATSEWTVTSIVNNTTYYTLTVTYVAGTAPANTDPLSVEFLRNGDQGYSTLVNGVVGSFGALPTTSSVGIPFSNATLYYLNGSANLATTTTTATAVTSTGVLTVTSTAGFVVNGAFSLSGTVFGGLSNNTTYYVTSILSSTQITFSTSQGGSSPGGLSTASGSLTWTSIASSLAVGSSGNFTIECWIYVPTLPSANAYIFLKDGVSGTNYAEYSIQLNSSGQLSFQTGNSTGAVSTSNYNISVISTNTWYHVAVMRSTTTIYLFLNGVLQNAGGTAQGTAPVSSNRNFYVGNQQGGGAAYTGYVSNLRIVVGSLVYSTSGFSMPSGQLGIVTNTQLLLNGSFNDSSNNFFVFTNTSTTLAALPQAGNSYVIANTGQLATYAAGTGFYNAGQIAGYSGSLGYTGSTAVNIPVNPQGSGYTLVAGDNGGLVTVTGGVTAPAAVFSAGANMSIYNGAATSQTITQGSGLTLTFAGTALTGNRTITANGLATIIYLSASTAIITGAGVT
jgi:hypothetical protein